MERCEKKRKKVDQIGDDDSGSGSKRRKKESVTPAPPPPEEEVEEFFAILRRMRVAVKYFKENKNLGDGDVHDILMDRIITQPSEATTAAPEPADVKVAENAVLDLNSIPDGDDNF